MAEVWPWSPQTILETLEFETDVRMARSAEWRDSLKDATQFLTLGHVLNNVKAERAIEAVRLNALGEWLVPEWPNASVTFGSFAAGVTVLPVELSDAYTVGQTVLIWLSDDIWETKEVSALGPSSITLSTGLISSYSGNQNRPLIVVPMILAIAPGGVEFQSVFPVQSLSVRFMATETVDLAGNSYPLHAGLPVVTDGRVPFQALSGGLNQANSLMASGFGAYALQQVETYTRRYGTISWYDKGYLGRWARRKFLHFLRGRDGAFWLPTGQSDLLLVNPVSSGALSIVVKPITTNAAMVGRTITITEGNNTVTRNVTGASNAGINQALSIAPTGVAFTTKATVSFAIKSRLDADQVEMNYFFAAGALASTCNLPVVEVP